MERLNLNSISDIVYRLRRGQSERAIAKDLGHSRHTVRRYHYLAEEKGYLDPWRGVPEPEELLREIGPPPSAPVIVSTVEPYKPVVEKLLKAGVEMATRRFIERKENWLLVGPTGVGKTHLAIAIGYEAIKHDMLVTAYRTHNLLGKLHASRADGSFAQLMRKVATCDLLILDDFGLRPVSAQGSEDLYEIIQMRYERGSIVLTSNRSPTEWGDIFGDSLLASAALDRLTHHARITVITGESYRQKSRRSDGGCE